MCESRPYRAALFPEQSGKLARLSPTESRDLSARKPRHGARPVRPPRALLAALCLGLRLGGTDRKHIPPGAGRGKRPPEVSVRQLFPFRNSEKPF